MNVNSAARRKRDNYTLMIGRQTPTHSLAAALFGEIVSVWGPTYTLSLKYASILQRHKLTAHTQRAHQQL